MNILITSGGTKIPIDRVRSISNMSSGTLGAALALAALDGFTIVNFLMAKKSKSPFKFEINFDKQGTNLNTALQEVAMNYNNFQNRSEFYAEYEYDTFESYQTQLEKMVRYGNYDAVILAAAVSDYGVENYVDTKIRSKESEMSIQLKALPKLISKIKEWDSKTVLVGFKLLADSNPTELVCAARQSIETNGCDMVVANDLRDITEKEHIIRMVTKDRVDVATGSRPVIAKKIIEHTRNLVASTI